MLIPVLVIYVIFTTVGISGNLIFVIALVKTKKFNSVLHYFIIATSCCDIMLLLPQPVKMYMLFIPSPVTQAQCLYIVGGPIIGTVAINTLYLIQGIDRLIAVSKPALYRTLQDKKKTTIAVMALFPICYTVFIMVIAVLNRTSAKKVAVCTFYAALGVPALDVFLNTTIAINVVVILLYLATWISIRRNVTGTSTKRLFISLLITVSLVIGGWIVTCSVSALLPHITKDAYTGMLIQLYGSLFAIFASMSNPIIYYTMNSEFRAAMRGLFGLQTKITAMDQTVTAVKTIMPNSSRSARVE